MSERVMTPALFVSKNWREIYIIIDTQTDTQGGGLAKVQMDLLLLETFPREPDQ